MRSRKLSIILATVLGLGAVGFVGCGDGDDPIVPVVEYNSTVPRTGQIKSYDNSGTEVAIGSIKDDGYYASQGVGAERAFDDSGINTIKDNATGLIWDSDPLNTTVLVAYPTACGAGYREPTVNELFSIADRSRVLGDPVIFSDFDASTPPLPAQLNYWSSIVDINIAGNQLTVRFDYGVDDTKVATGMQYLRCVNDSEVVPKPTSTSDRFVVIDDAILDQWTNLEWQNDTIVVDNDDWGKAIEYCEDTVNINGNEDWRLPNFNELLTLVVDRTSSPVLPDIFGVDIGAGYWSSTALTKASTRALVIDFTNGLDSNYLKEGDTVNNIRCVRTRTE